MGLLQMKIPMLPVRACSTSNAPSSILVIWLDEKSKWINLSLDPNKRFFLISWILFPLKKKWTFSWRTGWVLNKPFGKSTSLLFDNITIKRFLEPAKESRWIDLILLSIKLMTLNLVKPLKMLAVSFVIWLFSMRKLSNHFKPLTADLGICERVYIKWKYSPLS